MQLMVKRCNVAGFSLIEVLITLVVIGVGLLGLAKIQAAAVGNTQIARGRSLVALQTESLIAMMHANRGFWGVTNTAPVTFNVSVTTATDSNKAFTTTNAGCPKSGGTVCTPTELAAYDIQQWAVQMNANFPGYTAAGNCTTDTTLPVSCNITVTWNEKYVAVNSTTASAAAAAQPSTEQSYTVYVQP